MVTAAGIPPRPFNHLHRPPPAIFAGQQILAFLLIFGACAIGNGLRLDLVLTLSVGNEHVDLPVEILRYAYPRDIREAVWRLEEYTEGTHCHGSAHSSHFTIGVIGPLDGLARQSGERPKRHCYASERPAGNVKTMSPA